MVAYSVLPDRKDKLIRSKDDVNGLIGSNSGY